MHSIMELANLACEQEEGKGKRKRKKEPVGMVKVFDFQMPVIFVMFKLTVRFTSTTRTTNFELITQLRVELTQLVAKLENLSIHHIFNSSNTIYLKWGIWKLNFWAVPTGPVFYSPYI